MLWFSGSLFLFVTNYRILLIRFSFLRFLKDEWPFFCPLVIRFPCVSSTFRNHSDANEHLPLPFASTKRRFSKRIISIFRLLVVQFRALQIDSKTNYTSKGLVPGQRATQQKSLDSICVYTHATFALSLRSSTLNMNFDLVFFALFDCVGYANKKMKVNI